MNRRWRWVVPAVAAVLAGLAIWLILTGDGSAPVGENSGGGDEASLQLDDSSQDSVEELSGLDFPGSSTEFFTAQLEDGSQLDVTAVIPNAGEAAFLAASGLAAPVAGERVITHSSPLWDLNPVGTIRGVTDTRGEVHRAVELVEEDDSTRVRAVITPAA